MASSAVRAFVERVLRQGRKRVLGPWLIGWEPVAEGGIRWAVTCRRNSGGAVQRHRRERQARAALRKVFKGWDGDGGIDIVVQWTGVAGSQASHEGPGVLEAALKELGGNSPP